jgi:uncharacterized membrane-anchored protein YhcB (DUF1043 family)
MITRNLSLLAFALGALVVLWMGAAFVSANLLALLLTLAIAAVYTTGLAELLRYQQATRSLTAQLARADSVSNLDDWLQPLHVSLRNSVRQRITGERIALPGPVLTPYLVGLLVMLGLIGTFVGMVDTLKGAVTALEGTSELAAIRAGLAAPMKGLGMAFGTSVAGVAASAMLGFISTLSRRERLLATRELDTRTGTTLQAFSLVHNRDQTYKALQQQAQALPDVAEKLVQLSAHLERMSDRVEARLSTQQEAFHREVQSSFTALATSVEQSLQHTLAQSGKLVGEGLQPLVAELMAGVSRDVVAIQHQLAATASAQLDAMGAQFASTSAAVSAAWETGIDRHEQRAADLIGQVGSALQGVSTHMEQTVAALTGDFSQTASRWTEQQQAADQARLEHWHAALAQTCAELDRSSATLAENSRAGAAQLLSEIGALLQASEQLVSARTAAESRWLDDSSARMTQLLTGVREELDLLRTAEAGRGAVALERLAGLEIVVAQQLASLGQALEQPMTRLLATAAEAPRAAAEVIAQLRSEMSGALARDNQLLDERQRIMQELDGLAVSLAQSAGSQREAIEQLVQTAAATLSGVGQRFTDSVGSDVERLTAAVDHFAGGAIELSALGASFGAAVEQFASSNTRLLDNLQQVEASLHSSAERGAEQMGYYVAQAREIIDHNLMTQQELIEQLRQLTRSGSLATAQA